MIMLIKRQALRKMPRFARLFAAPQMSTRTQQAALIGALRIPFIFLCLLIPQLALALDAGIYYDRYRNGHGLGLQTSGSTLFGALFTYDADGEPTWYYIQTDNLAAASGTLTRNRRINEQIVSQPVGSFSLNPLATCTDGLARPNAQSLIPFTFTVDGNAQVWCVEPLLPTSSVAASALNGAWFQPATSGWGLLTWYYPGTLGPETFQAIFFNDGAGEPRWAFAQTPFNSLNLALDFSVLRSPCAYCSVGSALPRKIGSAQISLISTQPNVDANRVSIDLRFGSGAPFLRSGSVTLLSQAKLPTAVGSTREGLVQGVVDAQNTQSFRKIPYVSPPLGGLRWRAPQALAARSEVLDARTFGSGCPQPIGQALFTGQPLTQNEDCLQLNIWRPNTPGPHPVMLWIHGGGLVIGSAVDFVSGALVYRGDALARRDVVLVSINYRLGPLGYLSMRDFVGEFPDQPAAGNYGVLDQIAALKWVRDNVAAFGGDPANVTIFGESAGGVSVCALMAAPAARGLFHRAIMQSGNCRNSLPSLVSSLVQGDRVVGFAGCENSADRRACMRALTSAQVLSAGRPTINDGATAVSGETYGVNLDGFALTETPAAAVSAGRGAPVPLMIGVNDDEQTSLTPAASLPATVAGYESAVRTQLGVTLGNLALTRYPASAYATPQRAYQDLLDDVRFTCANRRAAADHAMHGNPVFHYTLSAVLPDPQLVALESFHGLDVVLLFGPRQQALAAERAVSEQMQRAWVEFARRGTPGQSLNFNWPNYSVNDRRSVDFNSPNASLIPDYRGSYCQFWAQYVAL